VQILPQDENWGENTTAVTGNTSEQSISMEDINNMWHRENDKGFGFACRRYVESSFYFLLGCGTLASGCSPRTPAQLQWKTNPSSRNTVDAPDARGITTTTAEGEEAEEEVVVEEEAA